MLIICPKCFAQYTVDETKFKEKTQIFQCSECNNRFEECVHFDDEKNTEPPLSIPAEPTISYAQPPVYQSPERGEPTVAIDFAPQSSAVLPEEFMPVNETPPSRSRKILYLIVLLLIFSGVGFSVYLWLNRDNLLKQYPQVQRAWFLLTTYPKSSPEKKIRINETSELPIEGETADVPRLPADVKPIEDVQVLVVPSIQNDAIVNVPQSDDLAQEAVPEQPVDSYADNRILPVESEVVDAGEKNLVPTIEKTAEVAVEPVQTVQPIVSDDVVESTPSEEEIVLEEIPMPVLPQNGIETAADEALADATKVNIHNVSFKYDPESAVVPRLFVQGVISNLTGEKLKMPPLQVQLFDANGTALGIKDLPYAEAYLSPNDEEFFFYDLSDIPSGLVTKINVTVKAAQ